MSGTYDRKRNLLKKEDTAMSQAKKTNPYNGDLSQQPRKLCLNETFVDTKFQGKLFAEF